MLVPSGRKAGSHWPYCLTQHICGSFWPGTLISSQSPKPWTAPLWMHQRVSCSPQKRPVPGQQLIFPSGNHHSLNRININTGVNSIQFERSINTVRNRQQVLTGGRATFHSSTKCTNESLFYPKTQLMCLCVSAVVGITAAELTMMTPKMPIH